MPYTYHQLLDHIRKTPEYRIFDRKRRQQAKQLYLQYLLSRYRNAGRFAESRLKGNECAAIRQYIDEVTALALVKEHGMPWGVCGLCGKLLDNDHGGKVGPKVHLQFAEDTECPHFFHGDCAAARVRIKHCPTCNEDISYWHWYWRGENLLDDDSDVC